MHSVLAYIAFHHVVVFLNVLSAPGTKVIVNERTRPLVTMELVMTRVEVKFAFDALFRNAFRYVAVAV